MHHIRIYLAIGLALIGISLIPFSLAEGKLTAAQKKAVQDCGTRRTACNVACGFEHGANRLSRTACEQDCEKKYDSCVDSAIGRRAPRTGVSGGLSSPPQVAPPTPTPKKISPQKVGGVTGTSVKTSATPTPTARK